MKIWIAALCLLLLALPSCAQPVSAPGADAARSPAPKDPETDDEKNLYALGLSVSRDLSGVRLEEAELRMVVAGLTDGVLKRSPKVDLESARPKLRDWLSARSAGAASEARKAAAPYLNTAASEKGARKLPSGVIVTAVAEGSGKTPVLADVVQVHFTGKLLDGTIFDTTEKDAEPLHERLGSFIPCLSQALQLMKEGGKSRVVCPPDTAYGDRGLPQRVGPGETLVFDLHLVKVGG